MSSTTVTEFSSDAKLGVRDFGNADFESACSVPCLYAGLLASAGSNGNHECLGNPPL